MYLQLWLQSDTNKQGTQYFVHDITPTKAEVVVLQLSERVHVLLPQTKLSPSCAILYCVLDEEGESLVYFDHIVVDFCPHTAAVNAGYGTHVCG